MELFKPKKKPRITPLTQKDIIVAELDCRQSIDRTQQYRQMIAKKHHPLDINSDEDAINRARTQTQQLKLLRVDNLGIPYEIQKQLTQQNRLIAEFNSLQVNFDPETNLHQMVLKIKKRVDFYSDKQTKTADALQKLYKYFHSSTVEGRVSVNKASSNSEILYQKIIQTRRSYKQLRQKLVDNSLAIRKLIQKSKNIESVVEITELWKKALIGKLSSFTNTSDSDRNLLDMVKGLDELKVSFKTQAKGYKQYECFLKMEQFLNKKRQNIIKDIQNNYQRRILDFQQSQYDKYVTTYNQLSKQNLIAKKISLNVLLQRNLSSILKSSYKQSYNEDINSLKGQQYIEFITQLTLLIQRYCKNWHLATRWHIQYKNQNDKQKQTVINEEGRQYVRFRKTIFQKIQQRISDIISKTYTFYKFTIVERAIFILKIHKLILQTSLFARETPKLIGQVIKKKCKEQRQIVQKGYLFWLKQLIVGQIRIPLFEIKNQPRPFQSGSLQQFNQDQRKVIQDFQNNKLNFNFQQTQISPLLKTQRKCLPLSVVPPQLPQFSSCLLICEFTKQINKRIYFNPKIGIEMFNKLKQMLELQVISIYCGCCPQQIQKQLQQDWSKFPTIKISKYDQIQPNISKIQYYKNCQKLQSQYYQLSVQIPYLLNKFPLTLSHTIISPSLQTKNELLENLLKTHKWIQTNIPNIFFNQLQKQQNQTIFQQLRLLQLLIKQLVNIIYTTIIQDTKYKYQGLASSIKDLKWEIKKYNNQISQIFKNYKNNYFSVFQSQLLSLKLSQMPVQVKKAIQTSLVNDLFRALTEGYCKIQKINANGRQLLRLDVLQIQQRVKAIGISTDDTFIKHLLRFIELGFESQAPKLQSSIKSQLTIFPFKVWKPLLVSCKAADEISWVERRDVLLRLAQQYVSIVAAGQPK